MFLDLSCKENKSKNEQMGVIKLKSFCTAKENIYKMKRQRTEWEKIFANDMTIKGLIRLTYINSSYNSTSKKKGLKNGQRSLIDIFPKKT